MEGKDVNCMKKYYLASPDDRGAVDLRQYRDTIISSVKSVIPDAEVKVRKEYYTVDHITRGQAVAVGRVIARSDLWRYHMDAPKLFIGTKIEKEETHGTKA